MAKGVKRFVLFSCGLLSVLVFAANYISVVKYGVGNQSQRLRRRKWTFERTINTNKTEQKVIILLSNQRSGSTFLGEIFGQNRDAFYLYEPLFPFTPNCQVLQHQRLEALERMMKCNFNKNIETFTMAKSVTKFGDSGSKCITNGVCFARRSGLLLDKYAKLCKDMEEVKRNLTSDANFKFQGHIKCGVPLTPQMISSICLSSNIVAFKVLRVCSLSEIDEIYKRFKAEGKQLYVIHLLRDPRAIISSKLKLELRRKNSLQKATKLCDRVKANLDYVRKVQGNFKIATI